MEILRRLVQARTGVVIDRTKDYAVQSALGPLARREGFGSPAELMSAIKLKREDRLMWAVAEAMTPSETAFFRDHATFRHFREQLLPSLAAKRGGEPVRVWSNACAAGQEIYSLAMIADEERGRLGGVRVELFGSDLSDASLTKAQAGLYTQFEVQRGLPIKLLLRYFERNDEMWQATPALRQMVRWRRINLLADLSQLGQFEVIFCRYVTGLFDRDTRVSVLNKLISSLQPGGYLVLGLDERADECAGLSPVAELPGVYTRTQARQAAA